MSRTTHGSKLRMLLLGSSIVAAGLFATGSVASASGGSIAVRDSGSCSASSDWKLKAKPDNSVVEVEFEVDSNVSGQTWNVTLKQDGTAFFSGQRMTHGASGSFTVSRSPNNLAGTHTFAGRAKNPATGEVCKGHVSA